MSAYPKIPESDAGWSLDPAALGRLGREPWAVTEKVHGANLSFVIEPGAISLHKRRAPLAPGEAFFGAPRVLARLEGALHALGARARAQGARRVQLFGELHGGDYPHPEVAPDPAVRPIQTGVWYCPEVRFVAFDLLLDAAFVDLERLQGWCAELELPCVTTLDVGPLAHALGHSLDFTTTLPAAYGLPALAGNLAEGVVLRPLQERLVPTAKGPRRALLKRKPARFAEDARYHQARPWSDGFEGPPLDAAERAALAWINPNRVAAARSKLGEVPSAELAEEVLSDVWEALREAGRLALLERGERELLREVLADAAREAAGA